MNQIGLVIERLLSATELIIQSSTVTEKDKGMIESSIASVRTALDHEEPKRSLSVESSESRCMTLEDDERELNS